MWVAVHGHRKREIDLAVRSQLNKIAHSTFLGLTHAPAVKLARELVEITPRRLTRVFYSDNGSTSVEIALKMAYQYWRYTDKKTTKNSFLSLKNAYHGDTVGSVSVGGMDLFHAKFKPLLFPVHFAPSPYCYQCSHRTKKYQFGNEATELAEHYKRMGCKGQCLKETEAMLKQHHKEIAAAVIEPMVQGAAGILTMPRGYVTQFSRLCKKYGVLLIVDEVATGFGRTGKMFAVDHEHIQPDFMCLSKGITGGYLPLAVTMTTEKIYKAFLGKFEEYKTFFHGHTYTANPLACAAALANLEVFRKERIIHALTDKTVHFKNELMALSAHPRIGDIRQLGMMAGIELVKNKTTGTAYQAKAKTGAKVCAACRKHGLIIRPLGDVIVLMPPLSITSTEISRMIDIVKKGIEETCK
jgi:adenosylmethionine-8-amino-7-oxononanoate transaminase